MLDGGRGPAAQLAMSIVVKMADVYGGDGINRYEIYDNDYGAPRG